MFSDGNLSRQYSAILYITMLCALLPDMHTIFLKHDVKRALQLLRYQVELRPTADMDFLLAASHRALAILDEADMHSSATEIIAITNRIKQQKSWAAAHMLANQRRRRYRSLAAYFRGNYDWSVFNTVFMLWRRLISIQQFQNAPLRCRQISQSFHPSSFTRASVNWMISAQFLAVMMTS